MKSYRKAAAALALALILSTSAFAGEMHTNAPTPAPMPTAISETHTNIPDGEIQTGTAESTPEAADTTTELALIVLQSLLTLF